MWSLKRSIELLSLVTELIVLYYTSLSLFVNGLIWGVSDHNPILWTCAETLSLSSSSSGSHVDHMWCCLLSGSRCRNHKMKKKLRRPEASEATLWFQVKATEVAQTWRVRDCVGFESLSMSSSVSLQPCWMLLKTWSFSKPVRLQTLWIILYHRLRQKLSSQIGEICAFLACCWACVGNIHVMERPSASQNLQWADTQQ